MSAALERRVKVLEQQASTLLQDLARLSSRPASQHPARLGIALGKTDGPIAQGASGTVSLYDGPEGSEVDTTQNVTGVWNKFGNIGANKWCLVIFFRGKKYLIAAECG